MKPIFAFLAIILCGVAPAGFRAQEGASTSSGVYTTQQATRGAAIYKSKCASCHHDDLSGEGTTPSLAGSDFAGAWTGRTVDALFSKIRSSMPSDQPGTLSAQQTSDLIAFLLKSNSFPAGKAELPADATLLKLIRIDDAPTGGN